MADPRAVGPQNRKANHSPLMQALSKRSLGETVNFCPFGCSDEQLDEQGACCHLIGFYDKGTTFEPRKRRKDNRIITTGAKREPMQNGFVLVRITTTARVYSPTPRPELMVKKEESDKVTAQIEAEERRLLEMAERVRSPILEGVWGSTDYDQKPVAAAAT